MPRLLVLTTLPHRRPESQRFERVNGRHSLRMSAPGRVGLPYNSYPRLILAYLTSEAVRTKNREIDLGATPNDLARKLGLSIISGPRGTATRLKEQLYRLLHMKLEWQTSLGLAPRSSGYAYVSPSGHLRLKPLRGLRPRRPTWRSQIKLGQPFFAEITRAAVPMDLRAIRHLQRSPLAIDHYVWLTYRMSYLKKPTLIPWQSLEAQFGADYGRLRDFKRRFLSHLADVLQAYPAARLSDQATGLLLLPSPTHLPRATGRASRLTRREPPRSSSRSSAPGRGRLRPSRESGSVKRG